MSDQYQLDPSSWSIRDWKNVAWVVTHENTLVCNTPAFVFLVLIASNGSGEADGIVWEGHGINPDNHHLQLYSADERYKDSHFMPPLFFPKGIYVEHGTNVENILVQYLPWNH